jgi:hypothetical protein
MNLRQRALAVEQPDPGGLLGRQALWLVAQAKQVLEIGVAGVIGQGDSPHMGAQSRAFRGEHVRLILECGPISFYQGCNTGRNFPLGDVPRIPKAAGRKAGG